ncbi:LAMI_0F03356g1_1 [Lachancea mirantina]|uniref:LAMI_0F03356g1_1 n=1 Tax=Lachancea mirantina TaxID=1230905 RepID=A0A1G4JX96_9SACH|nr:LAMI_0F03356g1_1 [Lachancea mirantina]
MSHGNTPAQQNPILNFSPHVPGQSHENLQHHGQQLGIRQASGASAQSTAQTPHHTAAYSPLVQKVQNSATLATPAPHVDNGSAAGLLASMTKNGLLGAGAPSTLRKVSGFRDFGSSRVGSTAFEDAKNDAYQASVPAVLSIAELPAAEKLRLWRHDALMQHHYRTAEYIGDKVYSMTHDPNDAFWLAQVYYNTGAYIRAVELLSHDNLDASSVMCRYLTALCQVKLKKYEEALDTVGETNPFKDANGDHPKNVDGGIKLVSSMCFLRGKIYCALNSFEKAKEAFKEAVQVDIKNFEAFDELISKSLLTPADEWQFLASLDFTELDDNEDLIKNLYISRLSKFLNLEEVEKAHAFLIDEYKLGDNIDVIRSKCDMLFTQCKFSACMKLCEYALERDELSLAILPTYISCLYEQGGKNKLFLISHKLAEHFPKSAVTWFSVGTYYMTINKVAEARKYFSKASIIDPSFGQAWIGFAHTYAVEGEHEQAVSAYATASRFFPGTHLPNLFLGMQYLLMDSLPLAEEYFILAYEVCPYDPLLLNEMGVMYFKKGDYLKAKKYLKKAWEAIKTLCSESKSWVSIHTNLAHTYRKLGHNERAVKCFKLVLETAGRDTDTLCALGFVYLRMNKIEKAIDALHCSLAINPSNQASQDLLKQALEINVTMLLDDDHPLLVSSNIQEKGARLLNRKREGEFRASQIAKKLKQGQESSDEEVADLMDVE